MELAARAGVDQGNLSRILNGRAPLGHEFAAALAQPLGVSGLSLLVANALFRCEHKAALQGYEIAFIEAGKVITKLPMAQMTALAADDFYTFDRLLTPISKAPSVIMKQNKSSSLILTDNQREGDAIPPAPSVVMGKGGK